MHRLFYLLLFFIFWSCQTQHPVPLCEEITQTLQKDIKRAYWENWLVFTNFQEEAELRGYRFPDSLKKAYQIYTLADAIYHKLNTLSSGTSLQQLRPDYDKFLETLKFNNDSIYQAAKLYQPLLSQTKKPNHIQLKILQSNILNNSINALMKMGAYPPGLLVCCWGKLDIDGHLKSNILFEHEMLEGVFMLQDNCFLKTHEIKSKEKFDFSEQFQFYQNGYSSFLIPKKGHGKSRKETLKAQLKLFVFGKDTTIILEKPVTIYSR